MKELLIVASLISTVKATTPSTYTETSVDITEMKITEIQEAVDEGYINYERIMKIYLERIDEYNDKYNAILYVNPNALEEAKKADEEYQKNGRTSDLFGLPIVVKDNIDVKGMPTTGGTKALSDNYPKEDAPAIKKVKEAGGIIIGKTNMSEFALSAYSSYSSYGHVKNAYNTNYSSYGSSGGTAVAVAANFAVAGLGTDTGGSVRLPSAANNLVGLRPTHGSVSGDGVIKYDKTRDTIGPITRYVEDNAILMDIISTKDTSFKKSISKKDSLKGIRIGVATQFNSPDSGINSLMNKAIKEFKSEGAEIVYINNFYNGYYSFNDKSFCYDFNQYLKGTTGTIRTFQELKKSGKYVLNMNWVDLSECSRDYTTTSGYKKIQNDRDNYTNYVKNKFSSNNVDVVIYPTIMSRLLTYSSAKNGSSKTRAYTITATGYPSMNLQIGKLNGLSYGMEMVTLANNESKLYEIASVYESNTKYYNNPTISKNLYTISDNLVKIKDNYKKSNSKYKKIDKLTKKYLKDYDGSNKSNLKESLLNSLYELVDRNSK